MKSQKLLESFVTYCQEHPGERFWQALRNWSKWSFVAVSNDLTGWCDTFFWEGRSNYLESVGPGTQKTKRIDLRHPCTICDKPYGDHEALSNRCGYGPKHDMLKGVKFSDTVFAPSKTWQPPEEESGKQLVQDRAQGRKYQGDGPEISEEKFN